MDGGTRLAMVRSYRFDGQPAAPGERLTIYATGIDRLQDIELHFGELQVPADDVVEIAGRPGIFEVKATIPSSARITNELPLSLTGTTAAGERVSSNLVSIAVEGK